MADHLGALASPPDSVPAGGRAKVAEADLDERVEQVLQRREQRCYRGSSRPRSNARGR